MRLYKIGFLQSILIAFAFTAVIGYFFVYKPQQTLNEKISQMEDRFAEAHKEVVKHEVGRIIERIRFSRENSWAHIENELRERAESARYCLSQRLMAAKTDVEKKPPLRLLWIIWAASDGIAAVVITSFSIGT